MPTLTERKPPKRAPGKVRIINPCAEPKVRPQVPGSYDVFYGPFDSWLNVKNPPASLSAYVPAAVGDGIADDTNALQAALDFAGQAWTAGGYWDDYNQVMVYPDIWSNHTSDTVLGAPIEIAKGLDPGWRNSIPGWAKSVGGDPSWNFSTRWSVLYIPAGTYRITKTLRVFNRVGLNIYGEDPRTTMIKWDGMAYDSDTHGMPNWDWINDLDLDMLVIDGGGTAGSIRRISFDGKEKARVGVNIAKSWEWPGGGGMELGNYEDLYIKNCGGGMKWGGSSGANDADAPVKRCRFENCTHWGVDTNTYNALNMLMWDCIAIGCGRVAQMGAGSIYYYNCLFINTTGTDCLHQNNQNGAARGNVSIRTNDVVFWEWPMFALQSGYGYWSSWTVQGNLIINAVSTSTVNLLGLGPHTLVDNAFYDSGYLDDSFDPTYSPLTCNLGYSAVNPWDAAWSENRSTTAYVSGNTYNRAPITELRATWMDAQWMDSFHYLNPMAPGYIPPNNLHITDAEIRSVLNGTKDNPLIQAIIGRMPTAPPITSPHAHDVVFTDIKAAMSPTQVVDAINDAIAHADPDKTNLIHFSVGGYEGSDFVFPGVPWALIGDSQYGTAVGYTYSWEPVFTFLPNDHGAVKLRIDELTVADTRDHYAIAGYEGPGVLEIVSDDMPGARVYADNTTGQGYLPSPGWFDNGSRFTVDGFDNLRARLDSHHTSEVYCHGIGKQITKSEDAVIQFCQLTILPRAGMSHFYVTNGGSIHVKDQYCENIYQNIDLQGGNGYFVWENPTKYHLVGGLPKEDNIAQAKNFTGHQAYLNWTNSNGFVHVDFPQPGSSTTLWGFTSWSPEYAVPRQILEESGVPLQWHNDAGVDGRKFFGLPGDATVPSNLFVSGSAYDVMWMPPYITHLKNPLPMIPWDDDTGWNDWIQVTTQQGFYIYHAGYGQPIAIPWYLWIGDESVTGGDSKWFDPDNGDVYWPIVRSENQSNHPAGTDVVWGYWLSEKNTLDGFHPLVMPEIVVDALKYRPNPLPAKITDPHVTDIVLRRLNGGSNRNNWIRIKRQ